VKDSLAREWCCCQELVLPAFQSRGCAGSVWGGCELHGGTNQKWRQDTCSWASSHEAGPVCPKATGWCSISTARKISQKEYLIDVLICIVETSNQSDIIFGSCWMFVIVAKVHLW